MKSEVKKVVICIHGFKTGDYNDFDLFVPFVEKNCSDFKTVLLEMYNLDDRKTFNYKLWNKKALDITSSYIEKGYQIYLIGYSMGAGVAGYVASKVQVEKLIFLAPSFHIIGSRMIAHHINLLVKLHKLKKKYKKRIQRFQTLKKKVVSKWLIFSIFLSVRKNRKYLKEISADTLIVLGLLDTTAPLKSTLYAYRNIASIEKTLWLVDAIPHLFMLKENMSLEVFPNVLNFLLGEKIDI